MRKKLIAGAAVLALLTGTPQVRADDDIVVFGGEFEEEAPAPKPKPAPIRDLPAEEPSAPIETPPPIEEPPPPIETPPPIEEPAPVEEPAPLETPPPVEEPPETFEPQPPLQPVDEPEEPAQIQEPDAEDDDDNFGDELVFDDLNTLPEQTPVDEPLQPAQIEQPADEPLIPAQIEQPADEPLIPVQIEQPPTEIERPFQNVVESEPVIIVPPTPRQPEPAFTPPPQTVTEPARTPSKPRRAASTPRLSKPQKELKMLKPRFVKLAVDDTYTYYLDKNSVQWKKMPYSSSEYMADVWIRMVEREAKPLEDDMAAYGADNFNAEIALAAEQGYQYTPEDLSVLSAQAYVLEHYYLRPKTNQIQFLCELEVFGRPQNTINERAYDYKNWENLVPGSVESVIYATVLKTIGTKKASERGHMTFIDMLEEYGRISLR